jgi:hypothetical protein
MDNIKSSRSISKFFILLIFYNRLKVLQKVNERPSQQKGGKPLLLFDQALLNYVSFEVLIKYLYLSLPILCFGFSFICLNDQLLSPHST